MPRLTTEIHQSLLDALEDHCAASGESVRQVVSRALAEALEHDHATLFQVSTSGALVEGVYGEAVTVADLRRHGDFGLGTFEGLDGEMVVLDGQFYRAHDDGRISRPPDSAAVPFATLTAFRPHRQLSIDGFGSLDELIAALDGLRRSDNLFYAVRIDGAFRSVDLRVVCRVDSGIHLDDAVTGQVELRLDDVDGSMVGFWSPEYSKAISIAGWHLHFLSGDRSRGGHVMGCRSAGLRAQLHDLDDLHLAMPETDEFLRADLGRDPSAAIDVAERQSMRR